MYLERTARQESLTCNGLWINISDKDFLGPFSLSHHYIPVKGKLLSQLTYIKC